MSLPVESLTAADAAAALVSGMPEINERAVSAALESAAPAEPAAPGLAPVVDKLNRPFDGTKFRVDASGKPRVDSLGRFIPIKLGAKAAGSPALLPRDRDLDEDPDPAQSFVAPDPKPRKLDPVSITVETSIGVIQTALVMLGDEEGKLSETEKMLLRPPLDRVMRKYDVGEAPAELDLAVALAGIIISRLSQPKTQGKIERLKMWFAGKVADHRGAQKAKAVSQATGDVPRS